MGRIQANGPEFKRVDDDIQGLISERRHREKEEMIKTRKEGERGHVSLKTARMRQYDNSN